MRVAVIGSWNLIEDIIKFIPDGIDELVSGGDFGINSSAEKYADENNLPKLIIKPEYEKYGERALQEMNTTIVEVSDIVVAIWDGRSPVIKQAIDYATKIGKEVKVHIIE